MRIEIYRFGHYVNAVDSKESLHQWLLDNVPYDKSDGFIPPTTTLDVCMMLAEKKNFTFKVNNDMEIKNIPYEEALKYLEKTYKIK